MLIYPQIDPVLLQIGPLKVHWYGFMYLVGFLAGWWLGILRSKRPNAILNAEQVSDLLFYVAFGVILGGRIGYVLFYDFNQYLHDPARIFMVWQGGMSFHGGFLGVLVGVWLFSLKSKRRFFELTDFIAPLVPPGIIAGRLGNFINGELWGRVTDVPWGMVFPHVDNFARHPSQLYQAAGEGVMLFIILWLYSQKTRPTMAVSAVFLLGYGSLRFIAEFFRTPDAQLGFIAFNWMTMGQVLCVPMLIFGYIFLRLAYIRNQYPAPQAVDEVKS